MSKEFKNVGPAVNSETIEGNVTASSTNIFLNFHSWLGWLFQSPEQEETRVVQEHQLEASSPLISVSFEWQIENFKICRLKPCEKLLSPMFHVKHRRRESDWQLVIYPNGDSKFLSIFLLLERSKQQVEMACKFTISLNEAIEERFTKTLADGSSEGNSKFILASHPQIQTKDLYVKCKLDLLASDFKSGTSVNEENFESDQIAGCHHPIRRVQQHIYMEFL
ncbi:uncharacterized protein LOC119073379 [Bradysia coprophila]|uniref:uncharacterized protein LOC119073379 n=1 Tax=Bradysia coprophila TaxID=38358 RepID=UPI00187DA6E7|nr:uncharacterized protein LOC119073379 [Bradysia coprophila]